MSKEENKTTVTLVFWQQKEQQILRTITPTWEPISKINCYNFALEMKSYRRLSFTGT